MLAHITLYGVNLELSEENLFRHFTISVNMNFCLTTSWQCLDWLVPNIYQVILSITTDVGWGNNHNAPFFTRTKVKVHYFGIERPTYEEKRRFYKATSEKKRTISSDRVSAKLRTISNNSQSGWWWDMSWQTLVAKKTAKRAKYLD